MSGNITLNIHSTKTIGAVAERNLERSGWIELVIRTNSGEEIELTCFFDSYQDAKAYAEAINGVNRPANLRTGEIAP